MADQPFVATSLDQTSAENEAWRGLAQNMWPQSSGQGNTAVVQLDDLNITARTPDHTKPAGTAQWLRKISLQVADESGAGLELARLRVNFQLKKSTNQSP